jgi:hypothetical protein
MSQKSGNLIYTGRGEIRHRLDRGRERGEKGLVRWGRCSVNRMSENQSVGLDAVRFYGMQSFKNAGGGSEWLQ